jgi:hypothetical protein
MNEPKEIRRPRAVEVWKAVNRAQPGDEVGAREPAAADGKQPLGANRHEHVRVREVEPRVLRELRVADEVDCAES